MTYDAYWDMGVEMARERAERLESLPPVVKQGTPSQLFRSVQNVYSTVKNEKANNELERSRDAGIRKRQEAEYAAQKIINDLPRRIENAVIWGNTTTQAIYDDDYKVRDAWTQSSGLVKQLVEDHFRCEEAPNFSIYEVPAKNSSGFTLEVRFIKT